LSNIADSPSESVDVKIIAIRGRMMSIKTI
jgi:hypothetical protein